MSNPSKRASILRRLVLMTWLTAASSVAVFAFFLVGGLRRAMNTELDSRADHLVRMLEEDLKNANLQNRRSDIILRVREVLSRNRDNMAYICLQFTGGEEPTGFRFTTTGNTVSGPQVEWTTQTKEELDKGPWADDRKTQAVIRGTGRDLSASSVQEFLKNPVDVRHFSRVCSIDPVTNWGTISVGMTLTSVTQALGAIYRSAWITGSALMLVGAIAAYALASNLIKPLRALQSLALKVSSGALNARANVKAGGEIGDLADSMNNMIESLEQSQVKLKDSLKSAASLREKEILLREIHHRVKNNMQILTSLLRLQTRHTESPKLREVLQESEARIRSMGLLHEKLYQSESVSFIDMHGYLRTLTGELTRVNTPQGTRREVKLNVQGVNMGLDTALPCGLMITELVTNSLKYAFPGKPEGSIYVSLGTNTSGDYQLVVWDNGVGMNSDFDFANATSLGMRLVKMLTEQLSGKLTLDGSQGTRIEVTFKESQYQGRI